VMMAVNQQDYLDAQIGNPEYMRLCPALFVCGSPLESDAGFPKQNLERAKQLLKEGGYDGTPVVVMQPSDFAINAPLGPVTVQAMRGIGMNVELQSMDWQTLVGRRAKQDPPSRGGWNIVHTTWVNADLMNPVSNVGINARGKVGGWFGWADDAEIERLRDAYAREPDPAKQKAIAIEVQKRAFEVGMYYPTGQYAAPYAHRDNIVGVLSGPVPVFWNIEKK
jgi:peptide/nickel transport system substrate-binding protein